MMMKQFRISSQCGFVLVVLSGLFLSLAACGVAARPEPPVQLLATDVHVAIGGKALVLPFAALEDYAYPMRTNSIVDEFLNGAGNAEKPLVLPYLSIVVRAYGWNDFDMRQRKMCPLLNRVWARSVCDNPWVAIDQALPLDRFKLVDLGPLSDGGKDNLFNCADSSDPLAALPEVAGRVALVCRANVYPESGNVFQVAVVRLDGDLGALWIVPGLGLNGETAETMARREGRAIASFVRNAIGKNENFKALQKDMCGLQRPQVISPQQDSGC